MFNRSRNLGYPSVATIASKSPSCIAADPLVKHGGRATHERRAAGLLALCAMLPCVAGGTPALSPACALKAGASDEQDRKGLCGFDAAKRSFDSTPADQAKCLLRAPTIAVRSLSKPDVPAELLARVGTKTTPTISQVEKYLSAHHVIDADVGGPVRNPISADYFVIHDTSSPNCSEPKACPKIGEFPSNMNSADWVENKTFSHHKPPNSGHAKAAHVMTNRVGDSFTVVDLKESVSHVKFDYCIEKESKRGLFVGVENIQPRVGEPAVPNPGVSPNDHIAPIPGFTDEQYTRLALIYVVASVRRGHWLVPAYHAVIDWYFADGHDDPQNFDLPQFSTSVSTITAAMATL